MKKMISLILCIVVLMSLSLSMFFSVLAIDAEESSLTLVYQHEGIAFAGLEIKIFRVADVNDDFSFALSGQFADYPVKLYGIESQAEWNTVCQTLQEFVWADGLRPTASEVTDESGTVKFEDLQPGLYLTMPISHLGTVATTEFYGFMTVIPYPESDDSLNYHVTAYPKSTSHSLNNDNSLSYKVVKQWKDPGFEDVRPESIKVDIFRNGEFTTTVFLSAENDWSYSWVTEDDGAVWTAVERDVSDIYLFTAEHSGNTIILTNTHLESIFDDEIPTTGDPTVLWPYILAACLSGAVLILLALAIKKSKR